MEWKHHSLCNVQKWKVHQVMYADAECTQRSDLTAPAYAVGGPLGVCLSDSSTTVSLDGQRVHYTEFTGADCIPSNYTRVAVYPVGVCLTEQSIYQGRLSLINVPISNVNVNVVHLSQRDWNSVMQVA